MNLAEEIEKMVNTSTKLAAIEALISTVDVTWLKKVLQMRPDNVAPLFAQEHSDFLAARMQLVIFYAEQLAELKIKYPVAAQRMERR